ncbi:MAG: PqqD family protein [Comamonadaceae bacterium]|nr:PqqD family protein [Comamonadaceae bacterium]
MGGLSQEPDQSTPTRSSCQIVASQAFQDRGGRGLLDLASASYFGLDEVGVSFWKQLQSDSSFQRACAELLLHFGVEPSQLANDLDALVRQLVDAGLVTVEQGIA